MPKKIIILENIRSAYNVGNVIRTADALGREVRITGYTPSPLDHPKVKKTSLGAEDSVALKQFDYTSDAIAYAKEQKSESLQQRLLQMQLISKAFLKITELI